jgi:hypothetical protein
MAGEARSWILGSDAADDGAVEAWNEERLDFASRRDLRGEYPGDG